MANSNSRALSCVKTLQDHRGKREAGEIKKDPGVNDIQNSPTRWAFLKRVIYSQNYKNYSGLRNSLVIQH